MVGKCGAGPTAYNTGFTGSGAVRRLHCNPAARHVTNGATVQAEPSGFGKADTLSDWVLLSREFNARPCWFRARMRASPHPSRHLQRKA